MEGSDLDRISQLRDQWFHASSEFEKAFNQTLDSIGFTEQYVQRMIADSDAGKLSRAPKVIKDNTWGMIEVDWMSVRLLDSPILQRLRAIKQLGFSYLTYPSAEHSRFIHSLGMYAVVSRFLDAMSRQPEEDEERDGIRLYPVKENLRTDLLHAAILHDCGHLPFSHVTESALMGDPQQFVCGTSSVDDFIFAAQDLLKHKVHFAEAMSLAYILNPRFDLFYRRYVRAVQDPEAVLRLAALVAGLKPQTHLRGAANLISNASVDADKVDYVNRDALACGIPVGLDVARLFLRSSFYEVSKEKLTKLRVPQPATSEVIFVVNASGVDTIDELAHARAALYQRVYLHQTTRNAERLLGRTLEALPEDPPDRLRNALHLLSLNDASLLLALSSHEHSRVAQLADRLRARQLPKRACVFGRSFASTWMPITDAIPGVHQADVSRHALGMVVARLRSDELKRQKLRYLESAILAEARKLASTLRAVQPNAVPSGDSPDIVTVLPMTELPGLSKEAVVLENRELIHSSQRSISDEQNEAADIYKALGYVLTEYEWREVVCLAARKVFAKEIVEPPRPLDVRRTQNAKLTTLQLNVAGRLILDLNTVVRRTGLSPEKSARLQALAADAGYFDETPWLVAVDPAEFSLIAHKLRKFEGEAGWSVTPRTCAAFISQFPPSLRAELVRVLEDDFRLIDREMVRTGLGTLIGSIAADRRAVVCGLTPNSGNQIRILLEQEAKGQLAAQGVVIEKSIEAALDRAAEGDVLILCDDNMGSGSQARCQLRAWMGVRKDTWPVSEQAEENVSFVPLTQERIEKFRAVRTAIAICVGNASSTLAVNETAVELGLNNFLGVSAAEEGGQVELSPALEEFMSKVGTDLIAYRKYACNSSDLAEDELAECARDALGYGNGRNLVATYLNVPTSTLTCFWHPGMFNGHPWMPFVIRRGYVTRLIVA